MELQLVHMLGPNTSSDGASPGALPPLVVWTTFQSLYGWTMVELRFPCGALTVV
jgi:hypothetical protein